MEIDPCVYISSREKYFGKIHAVISWTRLKTAGRIDGYRRVNILLLVIVMYRYNVRITIKQYVNSMKTFSSKCTPLVWARSVHRARVKFLTIKHCTFAFLPCLPLLSSHSFFLLLLVYLEFLIF